jgi:hypothetical protein
LKVFILVFILCLNAWADNSAQAVSELNDFDLKVYHSVKAKCSSGSYGSAFKVAFDLDNLNASINNSLDIISVNFYEALSARVHAGGLTPEMKALRHSNGFWLALVDCYGYKYGVMNRGHMIKQLIDLGHLSTEVTGVLAGVTVLKVGTIIGKELMAQYPLAMKFVSAGILSLLTSRLINYLYWSHPISMTKKDHEEYDKMKTQLFSEPDQAIQSAVIKAKGRIQLLKMKLKNETDLERKKELQTKIDKLRSSLEALYLINPKLKTI